MRQENSVVVSSVADPVSKTVGYERTVTLICGAAPATRCRRGRRGQRRAATSRAAQSEGYCAEPVVNVPPGDLGEKLVNSTCVRRRAKPGGTVTKVITDVSLEALRAKRNGTSDGATEGDKTIEEISRILLKYSTWQQQRQGSRLNHCRRRADTSGEASKMPVPVEAAATVDSTQLPPPAVSFGFTDEKQGHIHMRYGRGRVFNGAPDLRSHVMSLVQAGKLPADSLDVLKAMLRHAPQGGDLDVPLSTREKKASATNVSGGRTLKTALQKNRDMLSQELCSMGTALFGCQPPPCFTGQAGAFSAYGGYETWMGQGDCSVSAILGVDGDYSAASGSMPLPYGGSCDKQFSGCVLGTETAVHYGGAAPTFDARQGVGGGFQDGRDAFDDDDDVTAMLYDICEAAQIEPTPQKLCAVDSESEMGDFFTPFMGATFDALRLNSNTIPDATTIPPPSVTVTQSERGRLQTFRQAFLAHTRRTSLPRCESSGVRSSATWCTLTECGDSSDATMEGRAQDMWRGGYQWVSPNRTLFAYRTSSIDRTNEGETINSAEYHVPAKAILDPSVSSDIEQPPQIQSKDVHLSTLLVGVRDEVEGGMFQPQWIANGEQSAQSVEVLATTPGELSPCSGIGTGFVPSCRTSICCTALTPVHAAAVAMEAAEDSNLTMTPAGCGLSTAVVTPVDDDEVTAVLRPLRTAECLTTALVPSDLGASAVYFT